MESWEAGRPAGRRKRAVLSPRAWAYGPRLAQIVVTRRCNLACGYCNEFDHESVPVSPDALARRLDKVAELGTLFSVFTGGEPLLHPNIVELVRYASRCGFRERHVISNGYLLSREIVCSLNEAGLTHMQISVDGVHTNETTVKVLKPLEKKLEHLRKHARFEVRLNAVLGAGNDDEALEVARFAKQAGFVPRICVIHDHDGSVCIDERGKALLGQVQELIGRRWKEAGDYRSRLMNGEEADFKCRAGARYLYVDEHGDVHWCSQMRGVFQKPLAEYTWADLKEQFHTKKSCAAQCTVGCVRSASRFDEWRTQGRERPQG